MRTRHRLRAPSSPQSVTIKAKDGLSGPNVIALAPAAGQSGEDPGGTRGKCPVHLDPPVPKVELGLAARGEPDSGDVRARMSSPPGRRQAGQDAGRQGGLSAARHPAFVSAAGSGRRGEVLRICPFRQDGKGHAAALAALHRGAAVAGVASCHFKPRALARHTIAPQPYPNAGPRPVDPSAAT